MFAVVTNPVANTTPKRKIPSNCMLNAIFNVNFKTFLVGKKKRIECQVISAKRDNFLKKMGQKSPKSNAIKQNKKNS